MKAKLAVVKLSALCVWGADAYLGYVLFLARHKADMFMVLFVLVFLVGIVAGTIIWNVHGKVTFNGNEYRVRYSLLRRKIYWVSGGRKFTAKTEDEMLNVMYDKG